MAGSDLHERAGKWRAPRRRGRPHLRRRQYPAAEGPLTVDAARLVRGRLKRGSRVRGGHGSAAAAWHGPVWAAACRQSAILGTSDDILVSLGWWAELRCTRLPLHSMALENFPASRAEPAPVLLKALLHSHVVAQLLSAEARGISGAAFLLLGRAQVSLRETDGCADCKH